jgi:hypothetical protein
MNLFNMIGTTLLVNFFSELQSLNIDARVQFSLLYHFLKKINFTNKSEIVPL